MKKRLALLLALTLVFSGLTAFAEEGTVYAAAKKSAKIKKVTSLKAQSQGKNSVRLNWKDKKNKKKKISGYAIYRDGKLIQRVGKKKKSFVDTGLQAGTSYTYKVKAYKTYKTKKWYNKKTLKWQKKKPAKKYRGKSKKVKAYKYGKASPAATATTDPEDGPAPPPAGQGEDPAKSFSYGKNDDGTVTLTSYNGNEAEVNVPSEIGGAKVTGIAKECFRNNVDLIKLTVPEGVTSIGDYAFECCSKMQSAALPKSLVSIGKGAFSGCGLLTSLDLGGVQNIGKGAFLYCLSLKSVALPASLSNMGDFAFAGCHALESVEFKGNNITDLPDRAFCNCKSLSTVKLADSIDTIGKRAFSRCALLESVTMPSSLSHITEYAFEDCHKLSSVKFTGGAVYVEKYAFSNHPYYAPGGKTELLIAFPAGTSFEENALSSSNLCGISIVDGPYSQYEGDGSLYTEDGLTLVKYFPYIYEDGEFIKTEDAEKGEFRVPYGVTGIADNSLDGTELNVVSLPPTMTDFSGAAFGRTRIKSVVIRENDPADPEDPDDPVIPEYVMHDGCIYSSDGTHLVRFSKYIQDESGNMIVNPAIDGSGVFTVPDAVEVIDPYAFSTAGKVTVRFTPGTALRKLSEKAFYYSGILREKADDWHQYYFGYIDIPEGTEVSISADAFESANEYYDPDATSDDEDVSDPETQTQESIDQEDSEPVTGEPETGGPDVVEFESILGGSSQFNEEDYADYTVVGEDFDNWTKQYLAYNTAQGFRPDDKTMPYTIMYKGDEHYRSMCAVLNHDPERIKYSIENVGDDYEKMYLMMVHGLFTELERCKISDKGVIVFSGLSTARAANVGGIKDPTKKPTREQLAGRAGKTFTAPDMMSTTVTLKVAMTFSSSDVVLVIYAPKKALDEVGSVCIDAFSDLYPGEHEILFSGSAKYKILDVGKLKVNGEDSKTYVRVELLGKAG